MMFFFLCLLSLYLSPVLHFFVPTFRLISFLSHFISLLAHDLPRNNAGCTCHSGLPVDRIRLCWCLSVWLPLQQLPLLWWLRWRLLSICRPHHHPRMFYLCICVSVRVLHSSPHRLFCAKKGGDYRHKPFHPPTCCHCSSHFILRRSSCCPPPSSFMQ